MGIIVTPKIYTIGETLKQIRESHNCTQKYLAQMIGLGEATVRNYELGNRNIHEEQAEKIAKVFEVCKYSIMNPTLENEIAVMHVINKIDSMYDLKTMRTAMGEIAIYFDKSCGILNHYLKQLHDNREMLGKGLLKNDEYLNYKFKMGNEHI